MQRFLLLSAIYIWTAGLLGFMELQAEFERIGPETTLVTNHFTGEVRECRVFRSGEMSCGKSKIQPRHWVFALIPLWPGRTHLNRDAVEDEENPWIFGTTDKGDLVSIAVMVLIMAGVTTYVLFVTRSDGD